MKPVKKFAGFFVYLSVNENQLKKTLHYFIIFVWLANGLFCKILNLVPRHQAIVGAILGNEYASIFIKVIGSLEILLAVWVFSNYKSRLCTIFQIVIVATMNILEFLLVPELLLFGKTNILIATLFIAVLFYYEFILNKKQPTRCSIF